jgi:nitrite reductase (NADH) large subunit
MTRYVILGNSAAGLSAIDAIRRRDKDGPITVISKEPEPTYSRVALPYILSREKRLNQIVLQEPDYYRANGVMLISGAAANSIDTARKTVHISGAPAVTYDKLLIATGSECRVPPVAGIEEADPCYHWTLADTQKLQQQMANAKSCFVIGAGFISLLTVSALIKVAGLKYTVVEIADQVMPQLLDRPGGEALERAMREKGIDVILGDQAAAVERIGRPAVQSPSGDSLPSPSGRGAGGEGYAITLKSGAVHRAGMLVVGTGVRPSIGFLSAPGGTPLPARPEVSKDEPGGSAAVIETARGILVNERQETNVPDVYAAGDCAEGFDFLTGERCVHAIWPTAIDQGQVAGANMAGDAQTYPGSLSWNVTELFGITMASVGEFRDRPGQESIVFQNKAANTYRKILLDGNRIAGAVVIGRAGHVQDLGVVQAMIRRKTDVGRWRHLMQGERINYGMLAFETIKEDRRPAAKQGA